MTAHKFFLSLCSDTPAAIHSKQRAHTEHIQIFVFILFFTRFSIILFLLSFNSNLFLFFFCCSLLDGCLCASIDCLSLISSRKKIQMQFKLFLRMLTQIFYFHSLDENPFRMALESLTCSAQAESLLSLFLCEYWIDLCMFGCL